MTKLKFPNSKYQQSGDCFDDDQIKELFGNTNPDEPSSYVFFMQDSYFGDDGYQSVDFTPKYFHNKNGYTEDYLPGVDVIMPKDLTFKYNGQNHYKWDMNKYSIDEMRNKLLALGLKEIDEDQL